MMKLSEIELLARKFAAAHDRSVAIVTELDDGMEKLQRQAKAQFKKAYETEAQALAELTQAVKDSPEHFVKPRTIIFCGIKVGMQKGKGRIEIGKEQYDQVIRLIRKHFPEQADVLIITKEEPSKKNLSTLSVAELKKLGITVEDTGDQVLVCPASSRVDKMFRALLKDTLKDLQEDD